MRRKKIRLRYKKERVLLSDMLPYELPFIFTNRYFYRFLVRNEVQVEGESVRWRADIDRGALEILALLLGTKSNEMGAGCYNFGKKQETIPFTYSILHKPTKSRELSIIHPKNQIMVADFYERNKSLMLYYCGLDKFSLRHPSKVACFFYYRDKLHNTLIGRKTDPLELYFNEYENLRTYFSYKRYNNIYKFYEDYRYQRAEKKFTKLLKFDIQSCFDSIYTHSIAWACGGGKEIYKENFAGGQGDGTFGAQWDGLMQKMNYNETNGIVIGPEFSRIFAEVILQHIDSEVARDLEKEGLHWERNYVCYRYVDDYFFFFNDDKCKERAMELFEKYLKEFKLTISNEKTKIFERPFITDITMAKIRIDKLIDESLQYHKAEHIEPFEDTADQDVAEQDPVKEEDVERNRIVLALEDKSYLHFNARSFNQQFKAILKECNVDSKDVVNYTLARICSKLESDIKKFDKTFKLLSRAIGELSLSDIQAGIRKVKSRKENMITSFLEELLDSVFFLYSSNKRVNTTLKVINILNDIVIHLDNDYMVKEEVIKKYSDRIRDIVFKKIQDEISLVFKTSEFSSKTQLETLYFLILLKQLRSKYHIPAEELKKYLDADDSPEKYNALSAIILLYYYGNESQYANLKRQLVECLKGRFRSVSVDYMQKSAEYTILLLDLICCPYIDYEDKRKVASPMDINRNQLASILKYLKKQEYMFTKWTKVDITKELSAKISQEVYS
jgi:hypothetical protein